MSEKKKGLKRILAVAGCGAAVAGLLFLAGVAEDKSNGVISREMSANMPTLLVRDTINVHKSETDDGIIRFGEYNMFTDEVHTHYFNDLTKNKDGHKFVELLNNHGVMNCYHELRHAMNVRLQAHCDGLVTRELFVADEISAIVASYLAEISGLQPLNEGEILPYISYKINEKYDLSNVADALFQDALSEMQYLPPSYQDMFIGNEELSEYRVRLFPTIKKKTLINEMMTFEINGKPQNLLKLASKDVRHSVYKCINEYNNQR